MVPMKKQITRFHTNLIEINRILLFDGFQQNLYFSGEHANLPTLILLTNDEKEKHYPFLCHDEKSKRKTAFTNKNNKHPKAIR